MKKLCLALALVMFLVGCGVTPADPAETAPVPSDTAEASVPAETTAVPETTEKPEEPKTPSYFDPTGLAEVEVPEFYETRTVRPTDVTPKIDGVITANEWGSTPDFRLNATITGQKRTYCRDYFNGHGKAIPDMAYYWRFDEEYVYLAVSLVDMDYSANTNAIYQGTHRQLTVSLGGAMSVVVPADGTLVSTQGNMCVAYTEEDGVSCFEFAAPRTAAVKEGENGFVGYVEYSVTVKYTHAGETSIRTSEIVTRTTPMYQNENFTSDVFYLAAGTPAPAPTLTMPETHTVSVGDMTLQDGYTLRFGEPAVLIQGDVSDRIWGHYQFPGLSLYTDGTLRAGWSYNRATIEYKSDKNPDGATHSASSDGGETWTLGGENTGAPTKNLMKNGKYFTGFASKGAYEVDYLDKYTPSLSFDGYKMFFADDIVETVDKTVKGYEYDPATGKKTSFDVTVNWPYMSLNQHPGNMVYPTTMVFALSARAVVTVDGDLYYPLYTRGNDCFADSREEALHPYARNSAVYFFKSTDNGRTWDLISQVLPDAVSQGFYEPEMTVLPDGSFFMLMRTGNSTPCYFVRSTDKGVTWSEPEAFDYIGVMPQLCTLGCGVTLASYGRPTMRFAATADPAGTDWVQIDFPMSGGPNQSCYYTDILALDDTTALFIYTDFVYPNEDGVPVKTVLVRKVTVIKE